VGLAPAHAAHRLRRAVGLPDRDGVLVMSVEDGSPAADAGISQGDLIVAAAGQPIRDADDLFEALSGTGSLSLTLVRGAEERIVEIAA
jgi:S1-C subfamily serine protease